MDAYSNAALSGAGQGQHPDAELLALGIEYRAAREAEVALYKEIGDDESPEINARVDASAREMGRLSKRILSIAPKTVDGLRIVALCWAYQNLTIGGEYPQPSPCTDTKAVHSVMRWLVEGAS